MGCDIHMYKETIVNGKWVFQGEKDYDDGYLYLTPFYNDRNYEIFGLIAGVRRGGQAFDLKGFPNDASNEIRECFNQWGIDAHTPSYLTHEDLKEFNKKDRKINIKGQMHYLQYTKLFNALKLEKGNWKDYLYPYCGFTSNEEYIPFSFDVPLSEYCDDLFKKWEEEIKDNSRLVFWFDN